MVYQHLQLFRFYDLCFVFQSFWFGPGCGMRLDIKSPMKTSDGKHLFTSSDTIGGQLVINLLGKPVEHTGLQISLIGEIGKND